MILNVSYKFCEHHRFYRRLSNVAEDRTCTRGLFWLRSSLLMLFFFKIYMGVAADCEYTATYGSQSNATQQILTDWNTASALYKVGRIVVINSEASAGLDGNTEHFQHQSRYPGSSNPELNVSSSLDLTVHPNSLISNIFHLAVLQLPTLLSPGTSTATQST